MNYAPSSPVPSPMMTTPSYSPMERLYSCPSTPRPQRLKMKVTIADDHLLVPIIEGGVSSNRLERVAIADLPPMPLYDIPPAPLTPVEGDPASANVITLPLRSTTKAANPKLPNQRRQSLSHLGRTRKSFGARCA